MKIVHRLLLVLTLLAPVALSADNGSNLWLPAAEQTAETTLEIAATEVAVTGRSVDFALNEQLPEEGFVIRSKGAGVRIEGGSERALLYGAYRLVRDWKAGRTAATYAVSESPKYDLRILNHWDNLNGTIERGYAGHSIFWEGGLSRPELWRQYGRANASVGINGTVLNNVNASPQVLDAEHLKRVQEIAAVLRPYGMRVYLSINFSSPAVLGGLENSDPLNRKVQRWWREKVKEIYRLIPDFGGFLVKANSEGQPGPQDFGRTHAEGANMLADALKPFGGVVMWRAFVYNPTEPDRAKQAYDEFMPLDGQFRDNVIVQVKNGPVDFQPREPFTPLFGAMRKTPVMAELQITQEYLGFSNHLVYQAPLYSEFLHADTYAEGAGSTVARATDGSLYGHPLSAIAGVANVGLDANWCGHHFAQANWYCFGRLAWDYELTPEEIAREWLAQTFSHEEEFLAEASQMMLRSREACVEYMMPLGLHHLFAWGHHYGPEPWCAVPGARPDWLPSYYHKADTEGIGFDRSSTGSGATAQYSEPLRSLYDNVATCPDNLLLWFHHVGWDHRMQSGQTLWEQLCRSYEHGLLEVAEMCTTWERLKPYVDAERHAHVAERLAIQFSDAIWWKDGCLLYFQTFSRRPFPADVSPAVHRLEELKKIRLNMTHHN
ncbi:MAG: alpha-glucuronidase [Alistipes sp.]|nr:alpha-glucuronidase [Alistipes sp.]